MESIFKQATWNDRVQRNAVSLIRIALEEDLQGELDWTTVANVPENATAQAAVVARQKGVFVGAKIASLVLDVAKSEIDIEISRQDGDTISPDETALVMQGNARELLTLERTILNFMGRLSGIASLTREFVDLVSHTKVEICDTRKTTPGWRWLEKYAVRCGGGSNHRMGLYDAILIKDNHLAFVHDRENDWDKVMTKSIANAKSLIADYQAETGKQLVLQIEVDNLEQFRLVIDEEPDIILLDNMSNEQLSEAVAYRDESEFKVSLEASGGVNLGTVTGIAETGVDRISIGALTHSAVNFDLGLDWL